MVQIEPRVYTQTDEFVIQRIALEPYGLNNSLSTSPALRAAILNDIDKGIRKEDLPHFNDLRSNRSYPGGMHPERISN